jgi:hypothetical protein
MRYEVCYELNEMCFSKENLCHVLMYMLSNMQCYSNALEDGLKYVSLWLVVGWFIIGLIFGI